jgi:malonyl-CoA O-methyltransferase
MIQVLGQLTRMIRGRSLLPFNGALRPRLEEISVCEAYRLWAPTYSAETAISALDEQLAQEMLLGLPYKCLLDAGCGIGRRIQNIPNAIGIDLVPEMLAAGEAQNVVAGDIRDMPFQSDSFEMVWCRLVLGHLPDPLPAYRELCRVCAPGGYLFVTDFHSDAFLEGHRRTVTDAYGVTRTIEHYVHPDHVELAEQEGFALVHRRSGVIGPSIRNFYQRGIGLRTYRRDFGLKLVEAMLFRKRST